MNFFSYHGHVSGPERADQKVAMPKHNFGTPEVLTQKICLLCYFWSLCQSTTLALRRDWRIFQKLSLYNRKVDIHIRCEHRLGVIELKSFRNVMILQRDRGKAAGYAKSLGLDTITMAVSVPVLDEAVLAELSGSETVDGIEVTVVAIGWV